MAASVCTCVRVCDYVCGYRHSVCVSIPVCAWTLVVCTRVCMCGLICMCFACVFVYVCVVCVCVCVKPFAVSYSTINAQ